MTAESSSYFVNKCCKTNPTSLLLGLWVVVWPLLASNDAFALSCTNMAESYYLACEGGRCRPLFLAGEVKSDWDNCARRTVISAIAPGQDEYLVRLAHEANRSPTDGIHRMVFHFHWWQYQPPRTFADWRSAMAQDLRWPEFDDPGDALPPRELLAKLASGGLLPLLENVKADASQRSIAELRAQIESESDERIRRIVFRQISSWLLTIALGIALTYSALLFRWRLLDSKRQTAKPLVAPIAFQLLLAIAVLTLYEWVFAIPSVWTPLEELAYFLFDSQRLLSWLMPAVVVLLVMEVIWTAVYLWHQRGRASGAG